MPCLVWVCDYVFPFEAFAGSCPGILLESSDWCLKLRYYIFTYFNIPCLLRLDAGMWRLTTAAHQCHSPLAYFRPFLPKMTGFPIPGAVLQRSSARPTASSMLGSNHVLAGSTIPASNGSRSARDCCLLHRLLLPGLAGCWLLLFFNSIFPTSLVVDRLMALHT